MLGSDRAQLDRLAAEHRVRILNNPPPSLTPARARDTFDGLIRTLRRVAPLTQSLETMRREGIMTPTAVAYTLGRNNQVGLTDIIGPEGIMAPMTTEGATTNNPNHPQRAAADQARYTRVGNIFTHLLTEAKQAKIVVGRGYQLDGLASALKNWLDTHLAALSSPDELLAAEGELRVQIALFLPAYNRRD